MYVSRVITGKIIEMRGDSVVTVQGDTVNTYHLRYYSLREVEVEPLPESEPEPLPKRGGLRGLWTSLRKRDAERSPLSHPLFWKKGANRI
ncbi:MULTISPECIES: hypothetical protein [Paenibacillus]|uniref:hypothetical protein n=1 Tax=Paenibacillus TaxID=44249 RepID=UPI002FE03C6C